MPSIKVKKNIDFNKLDFHREVNLVIDLIKLDIRDGIQQGIDINSRMFKKLKDSTIESKMKKGYAHPTTPLWATGLMRNIFTKPRATKNKPRANIGVAKKRVDIGRKHNEGDNVPKREWFGIGSRAKQKIERLLAIELKEKLRI